VLRRQQLKAANEQLKESNECVNVALQALKASSAKGNASAEETERLREATRVAEEKLDKANKGKVLLARALSNAMLQVQTKRARRFGTHVAIWRHGRRLDREMKMLESFGFMLEDPDISLKDLLKAAQTMLGRLKTDYTNILMKIEESSGARIAESIRRGESNHCVEIDSPLQGLVLQNLLAEADVDPRSIGISMATP